MNVLFWYCVTNLLSSFISDKLGQASIILNDLLSDSFINPGRGTYPLKFYI